MNSVFRATQILLKNNTKNNYFKKNRVWLPTMPITLTHAKDATPYKNATATFRVLPKMTKHEIKEYLTKIYGLPVQKVNTMIYHGKRKRVLTSTRIHYYKYKDYKKAIVTFSPAMQQVGKGASIPELQQYQQQQQDAESDV